MKGTNFFLGVFSSNELKRLKILKFPSIFIVNIAEEQILTGHWIAIRIDQKSVEIFDSLGFSYNNWGMRSPHLKLFVDKYRVTHKIFSTPVLQPLNSYTCGYYCLFYVLFRKSSSFRALTNFFSKNLKLNDERVLDAVFRKIN